MGHCVTSALRNCVTAQLTGAAAAGFRLSDAGTFPVDLDCLALDAQLRSVEQHVASPKGANSPRRVCAQKANVVSVGNSTGMAAISDSTSSSPSSGRSGVCACPAPLIRQGFGCAPDRGSRAWKHLRAPTPTCRRRGPGDRCAHCMLMRRRTCGAGTSRPGFLASNHVHGHGPVCQGRSTRSSSTSSRTRRAATGTAAVTCSLSPSS
jgi:hypothetical protein